MPIIAAWRSIKGTHFERLALRYLEKRGLRLVSANYRCRLGEIDLVLLDGATLVFLEVRYRADRHFGGAVMTIDHRKQRKLIRTAKHFLLTHRQYQYHHCRFDVIGIETAPDGTHRVEWIPHAFY